MVGRLAQSSATVAGYALVSLMTVAVPLLLGAAGVNQPRVLLATMTASFLVHAAIIMAFFHTRSATWAWAWWVQPRSFLPWPFGCTGSALMMILVALVGVLAGSRRWRCLWPAITASCSANLRHPART
jgi:hypothetical protein